LPRAGSSAFLVRAIATAGFCGAGCAMFLV
jgi:hypothetical protein